MKTKAEVETHFGQSATFAKNLLDMTNRGEKTWAFLTGAADGGWDVTVGFFQEKARYVVFKKRTASKWIEGDTRSVLVQIGRFVDWSYKPGSDYFDYAEKSGDKIVAEATGWQTPSRTYAFAYVPTVSGDIAIAPDKTALDQKAGN
ncbi:MAG: hypothetical protein ACR2II_07430 [Chthoniobacterales bacterium]